MKNPNVIDLSHSKRRPHSQAWCASSCGHSTYGNTKEEALERHRAVLESYTKIKGSLKLCAKQSACPKIT